MKEQEILALVNKDRYSKRKRKARKGVAYYEARHDILDYKIYFIDADGILREDLIRSNIRVSHPFFTELVDQEVQYILSGGIQIKTEKPELQEYLESYFDEDFVAEVTELLEGTITKGWDYLISYKGEGNRTRFLHFDSLGIIEIKNKEMDTTTDAFIYYYSIQTEQERPAIRIEYWDEKETTYYIVQEGKIKKDPNARLNPKPHVLYKTDNDYEYEIGNLGYLPLFRLDNNKKQISALAPIKDMIDDYDLMDCGLSNNVQDAAEELYVVKGYKPTGGRSLDEMIFNIRQKRQIGVGEHGDVDIKTVNIPVEARKTKMEEDEKNIYRFGMGFNSSQVGDGNITNIVIKSRYFLLDLKCNKLQIRLQKLLKQLLNVVLQEINEQHGTVYQASDVKFILEREVMTNAQDNATIAKTEAETRQVIVNTILSIADQVDDETVIKLICETLDLDYEEIRNRLPEREQSIESTEKDLNGGQDEGTSETGGAASAESGEENEGQH